MFDKVDKNVLYLRVRKNCNYGETMGKTVKKKFTGILLSFCLLCMGLLAGCSLVETDYSRYYDQVVAVVENKKTGRREEITKLDLISGYSSYGYTYEQYYGYSRQEAIETTIELLENRKITIITAEDEYGYNREGKGLSDLEKTYLWQQVVDTLNDNLNSYYESIIGAEEEENEDEITFEGYDKTASLVVRYDDEGNSYYAIESLSENEHPLANFKAKNNRDFNDSEDRAMIFERFRDFVLQSDDDYKRAYNNYLNDLLSSERGQNLSKDAPSVFEREIERLYNTVYENYLLELYSYNSHPSTNDSSITPSQIVNLYVNKVRSDYVQYMIEGDSDYDSDVQDSLNDVYYFKTDEDSTKYFTVANVLFMFDEQQQAKYEELTEKLENNDGSYFASQYDEDIKELYSQIKPVVRQYNELTGVYEEIESDLTVDDIEKIISQELTTAKTGGDINTIGDKINEFIYTYGEDTGMFNAESNYVIGVDSNGDAVSSFVDSFNEAGLKLYNNGKGQIGDMEIAYSEYGIHLIIYTGACENLFGNGITGNFTLDEEAINVLNNTRVNLLVDKTYFDVLYDELFVDNFSNYESVNMEYLRRNYTITVYTGSYSDLLG